MAAASPEGKDAKAVTADTAGKVTAGKDGTAAEAMTVTQGEKAATAVRAGQAVTVAGWTGTNT